MDADTTLSLARGQLIKAAPWLAAAFGRLEGRAKPGMSRPGTDGAYFYYDSEASTDAAALAAALAHVTAHCLLGHLRLRSPGRLETDMAAALLLDALLPEQCPARGAELYRQARHHLSGVPLENIAEAMARDGFFAENREALSTLLTVDDHRLWTPEAASLQRRGGSGDGWDRLRRAALQRVEARRVGRGAGDAVLPYQPRSAPNHSYRALLSPYAEYREQPREDPDNFDRNLYAYGLERYGNLPILEPAETREAHVIDELAIVIDTSGSCLRSLTARFLDETRALLADGTLFAPRFNLRILQCDARVQRDDAVTCLRDFEDYLDHLQLVGGGGTDFRPAFERIDRLIERGAFRRLRFVLFFSDGMGLFPARPSDYDALFVFFKGRYDDIDVPKWAQKFVLEE